MVIAVDVREKKSVTAKILSALTETTYLPLSPCDYVAGDTCIERKTPADLLSSITDGRLSDQLERMSSYPSSVLMVEGCLDEELGWRKIDRRPLSAALASVTAKGGGRQSVVFLPGPFEAAHYIYYLSRQKGEPRIVKVEKAKTSLGLIQCLPGVGPSKADLLISRFGSPLAVFNASVDELSSVPGISRSMARRIKDLLTNQT